MIYASDMACCPLSLTYKRILECAVTFNSRLTQGCMFADMIRGSSLNKFVAMKISPEILMIIEIRLTIVYYYYSNYNSR